MPKLSGARMPEAIELARAKNTDAKSSMLTRLGPATQRPLNARRYLLASLLQEENLPKKLSSVLAAIEADSTPPEQDPLWPHLTESLAELWQGETATRAMDLVIAETRPRARQRLDLLVRGAGPAQSA